jgi:hypothetical protein
MSAILEEGIGFGGTDKDYPPPNSPTDVIISQYESIMNRNIAAKSFKSATTGEPPTFTKEEMAYLTKKAIDESSFSEVKVITPSPTITLKKGNTEINIKNAAEVVRKMEEKYPKGMTESSKEDILRQPFIKASLEHGIKEMENTFVAPAPIVPQHTETKSVNKNAYEIRAEVLKMSMEFFKWQYEMKIQLDRANGLLIDGKDSPTSEKALEMAKKFYQFVEQRR